MENKEITSTNWHKECLVHCEEVGISKSIINVFIHLQEQKHEQDHKKTSNSRI